MPYFLSPIGNVQTIDANGDPLVGGTISTFLAGTSTPATTYTDDTGGTPQGVVMTLNANGYPINGPVWMLGGVPLKFIIKNAAGVTQSTFDNISGIGDTTFSADQFLPPSETPTYISAVSFSLVGDKTNDFEVARRVKSINTGGTTYSTISASVFGSGVTTVTVVNTSGVLDSGLSSVSLGLLTATNNAIPDRVTPLPVAQGGIGDIYGAGSALIQRQVASVAVASIDFTTIYNSTFNSYEIEIERLLPTTTTVNLLLQFQVAGSWVTAGYYWANWRWTTAGSGVVGQGGTGTGISLTAATADNMSNSGNPAAFIIRISNCAQTTAIKRVSYEGAYVGSTTINIKGNGESAGTGAVTGFRLIMDSGTIQAGAVATLRGFR
ncbi:MAG: hypothetical protein Q7T46_11400 [Polaromonas sp.]|nr:hypothetical protein [Polaromonas sp.]